jgi:hypothetical protein
MLTMSLMGDFCTRLDGAPVADIGAPHLQSLLAYLTLRTDAPHSRTPRFPTSSGLTPPRLRLVPARAPRGASCRLPTPIMTPPRTP